ncbi:MAG: VanZ family protein [Eubacterium sp.]
MRLDNIFDLLKQYIVIAGIGLLIALIVFIILYFLVYKRLLHGDKKVTIKHILLFSISFIYIFILIGATFFNRETSFAEGIQPLFSSYRLAWHSWSAQAWRNIILNILLFTPLGFLLPLWNKKLNKIYIVLPCGIVLTILIELAQYILKIGIFEFDDILNNTFGVLIGFTILQIALNIYNKKINLKNTFINSIPSFAFILIFIIIFSVYQIKPYGNLDSSYYVKQNMKNITVTAGIDISDNAEEKQIYKAKEYSNDDIIRFAENLFGGAKANINYDSIFIGEDVLNIDSTDNIYHFSFFLKTGEYNFHNETYFQTNSEQPSTSYSEKQVREALSKYSILVPDNCYFSISENGSYQLTAKTENYNKLIYNGTLYCTMFSDSVIGEIDNRMVELSKCNSENIISENDAVSFIKKGKFSIDEKIPEYSEINISNIDLIYIQDSKNFYQPVYQIDIDITSDNTTQKSQVIVPCIDNKLA